MILELKPDQQELLDRAAQAGMSPEMVLNQAFAVIREQLDSQDRIFANHEAVVAHIAEGFEQAQRGELIGGDDVARILKERRAKQQAALQTF